MNINSFVDKISSKYNYDYRTINALKKIIPALIEYYGLEYLNVIIKAIEDCEIIHCDSYNTISSVIYDNNLLSKNIVFEQIKNDDGIYISKPIISYNSLDNQYKVDSVVRKVIVSHTFNFDSPKGLEVLTYQLCSLIKSFYNEYIIDGNVLYKRNGLVSEKFVINNDKSLSLLGDHVCGGSLDDGMNIYDTEKIVSLILKDEYKCYRYDSIATIAMILKEKFKLKDVFNNAEIYNDIKSLKRLCGEDQYENLLRLSDKCFDIEEEMLMYSLTRDKKDELSSKLSLLLSGDVYNCLIQFGLYNTKKRA